MGKAGRGARDKTARPVCFNRKLKRKIPNFRDQDRERGGGRQNFCAKAP